MKELGYQPHAGARSLRSRKSRVLGVVVPYHEGADAAAQHYMLITLAQLLREHDFDLLLITADEGAAGLRRVMQTALCDGLFIMEVRFNDARLGVVAESKIPTVFIGTPGSGPFNTPIQSIDVDYYEAGRAAVHRLRDAGARNIAFVHSASPDVQSLNFVSQFRQAVVDTAGESGIPLLSRTCGTGIREIRKLVGQIAGDNRIDSYILGPTISADDWCNALIDLEIRPGRDVSLVASGWSSERAHCLFDVDHFDTRPGELLRRAVEMLVAQIDGEPRKEAATEAVATGSVTSADSEAKIRRPVHGLTLLDPIFVPGNTVVGEG
jgi:lacI family transcription regulator